MDIDQHCQGIKNLVSSWTSELQAISDQSAHAQSEALTQIHNRWIRDGSLKRLPEYLDTLDQCGEHRLVVQFYRCLYMYLTERNYWQEIADEYGPRALQACVEVEDVEHLYSYYPEVFIQVGIACRMLGRFDDATKAFGDALVWAENDDLRARAVIGLTDLYRLRRDINDERAVLFGHRAVDIARNGGEPWIMAKAYEYLGLALVNIQRLEEGIDAYEASLEIRRESRPFAASDKARLYSYLVFAYSQRGKKNDLSNAKRYYEDARELYVKNEDLQGVARLDGDFSVAYLKEREPSKAIALASRAFRMADDIHKNGRDQYLRARENNRVRMLSAYLMQATEESIEKAFSLASQIAKYCEHLTAFEIKFLDPEGDLRQLATVLRGQGRKEDAVHVETFADAVSEKMRGRV